MNKNQKLNTSKNSTEYIYWIGLLLIWGIYSYYTFQTSSQKAMIKYNLGSFQLSMLRISVVVPMLFIWSAILYSFLKLHDYSQKIIKSKDGVGFRFISNGIFFILLSSIVSSYLSLYIQFVPGNQIFLRDLRILNNYIQVVFSLLSFYLIWKGSKKFVDMVNAGKKVNKQRPYVIFSLVLISLPYIYFVFQNSVRSFSSSPDIISTYNLPDILIFPTIVLPYIISWWFGIMSVVNMSAFKEETKGVIYKSVLDKFYKGFLTVILLFISLQYFTQFSAFFTNAGLSLILVIIYVILLIDAVGFIFVARGTKSLNKLEIV